MTIIMLINTHRKNTVESLQHVSICMLEYWDQGQ